MENKLSGSGARFHGSVKGFQRSRRAKYFLVQCCMCIQTPGHQANSSPLHGTWQHNYGSLPPTSISVGYSGTMKVQCIKKYCFYSATARIKHCRSCQCPTQMLFIKLSIRTYPQPFSGCKASLHPLPLLLCFWWHTQSKTDTGSVQISFLPLARSSSKRRICTRPILRLEQYPVNFALIASRLCITTDAINAFLAASATVV